MSSEPSLSSEPPRLAGTPVVDEVPVTVLYIGGEGRSGSTVLSAILGNHPGYFPVGELPDVWIALQTNELCGCNQPFASCEFWRAVGDVAFGGWANVNADVVNAENARFTRHRRVPKLLMWSRGRRVPPGFRNYQDRLSQLYRAIKEVSGCSVIVDSTKAPPFAMFVQTLPAIDLRVLHLVRDSRGVAFSWGKENVRNPQYANHPTLRDSSMGTISAWKMALTWDLKNALLHLFVPRAQRLLVRYEALVNDPSAELGRILQFAEAGRVGAPTTVLEPSTFTSRPFHTLGGNPIRFSRGGIQLRADTEWRTRMSRPEKFVVSALTFPWLAWYGYAGRRRAASHRHSLNSRP